MTPVLSIDWDFWIEDDPTRDYGHVENKLFIDVLWTGRASSALAQGIDLRKDMFICEEPHPVNLPPLLYNKGISIKHNQISMGESHSSAYHTFKDSDDLWIVHVDAHHDCGYTGKSPITEEHLCCGNWIQLLNRKKKLKKLTLVYPKWRQEQSLEYKEKSGNLELTDNQLRKFDRWRKAGTEVEIVYGLENLPNNVEFQKAYIAKSGAWVPPWLDKDFQFFIMTLVLAQKHTFYNSVYFTSIYDVVRDFSWKQVKEQAEQIKNATKSFQEQGLI